MKIISGADLFESFGGIRRGLDSLEAIASGVCPTCHQRTRYSGWLARRLYRLLSWLEPVKLKP